MCVLYCCCWVIIKIVPNSKYFILTIWAHLFVDIFLFNFRAILKEIKKQFFLNVSTDSKFLHTNPKLKLLSGKRTHKKYKDRLVFFPIARCSRLSPDTG